MDFLSFQRPGTAYGATAFKNAAMGTATQSGFFDAKTKEVKPFEMMESRKAKSVLSQLWFARAEKILKQVDYLMNVLEFIEYASVVTHRVTNEYMVTLQTDQKVSSHAYSQQLHFEMKQSLELYQTYQLDYDLFDHLNRS